MEYKNIFVIVCESGCLFDAYEIDDDAKYEDQYMTEEFGYAKYSRVYFRGDASYDWRAWRQYGVGLLQSGSGVRKDWIPFIQCDRFMHVLRSASNDDA
jgi:hypothetical protein